MILKLVSSLAPGSNKFLREATKQHNLFDFLSSIATPRAPFLNFLLTPTEHISGSCHRDFTITFKFFFQFIGTDPNAPHYHRNHSCPYILQFSNFSNRSWYFSAFSSSFSLPGPSSGIATSIFWQLLSLSLMITKSSLLASISWSGGMLKSHKCLKSSFSLSTISGTWSEHLSFLSTHTFLSDPNGWL